MWRSFRVNTGSNMLAAIQGRKAAAPDCSEEPASPALGRERRPEQPSSSYINQRAKARVGAESRTTGVLCGCAHPPTLTAAAHTRPSFFCGCAHRPSFTAAAQNCPSFSVAAQVPPPISFCACAVQSCSQLGLTCCIPSGMEKTSLVPPIFRVRFKCTIMRCERPVHRGRVCVSSSRGFLFLTSLQISHPTFQKLIGERLECLPALHTYTLPSS